jgi:uncharacterized protein
LEAIVEDLPQNVAQWIDYVEEAVGSISPFQRYIIRQFKLDLAGIHGVRHWIRVYENGSRLAEKTHASINVIRHFALMHDSCRLTNGQDMDHGPRAATLAMEHRKEIDLSDDEFDLLVKAIAGHTVGGYGAADITIQTCIDADRLDLVRIGVTPLAELLCTDAAKDEALRSNSGYRELYFPKNMRCVGCGKKIRALRAGVLRCPHCGFVVRLDGRARIFL